MERLGRIEICGGIASGKTTLTTLFENTNCAVTFENFKANPFWEAFYHAPALHSFETEVTFLLQHFHQIKVDLAHKSPLVCDFSFLLDLAYADINLVGSKHETFLAVYNEVTMELGPPDLVVHLRCRAGMELARIKERGRTVEQSVTTEYLDTLNKSVARQVDIIRGKSRVLQIDSERTNFATNKADQQEVVNLILERLL